MAKRVGLISLGCEKNLIDSEQMLYKLDQAGYEITPDIEGCDVVVINTCGFIEGAKEEAIDNTLEVVKLKEEGKVGKIILAGCLVERYKNEILKEIPEVDALVGSGAFSEIVPAVEETLSGEHPEIYGDINAPLDEAGRIISTADYTAYLRIAEGCNHKCSFCVIPSLRGKYRSRKMEDIFNEAKTLCENGTKELIIIAQDITNYGIDLYGKKRLVDLLKMLSCIDGLKWIRLHYLYPNGITDELIDLIAKEPKICKYLDIPIQHINDRILRSMNRPETGNDVRSLLNKLREKIPGVVIRTSLIVGYPGETKSEFNELCAFLKEAKIERAGVFPYSQEEGTPAAEMPDQIEEDVKNHRVDLVLGIQQKIMDVYNKKQLGKTIVVLCEGWDKYAEYYYGRTFADTPEVDGKIFFTGKGIKPGEFVNVKINDILGEDLIGEADTIGEK